MPEGVTSSIHGKELVIKGPIGENKRTFDFKEIEINVQDNKITLKEPKSTKKEKKLINSFAAHISGMVKGTINKYEYILEICSVHFPMTIKVEKDKLYIKNFLGERKDKVLDLIKGVEVEIKGNQIFVRSTDKEKAGLQASLIEKVSRIGGKDRRVFQDGIWIVKKEKGR